MKRVLLFSAFFFLIMVGLTACSSPGGDDTGGDPEGLPLLDPDAPLSPVKITLPKASVARTEATLADAIANTNYFEVCFRYRSGEGDGYRYYVEKAFSGEESIPCAVPAGFCDIVLLAGHASDGYGGKLLLASGYVQNQGIIADTENVIAITLYSVESAFMVPPKAMQGQSFLTKFEANTKNPFIGLDSVSTGNIAPLTGMQGFSPLSYASAETYTGDGNANLHGVKLNYTAPPVPGRGTQFFAAASSIFGSGQPDPKVSPWHLADCDNPDFASRFQSPIAFIAAAYFVDQNGSDTHGDGSETSPFAAMNAALAAIRSDYAGGTDWPIADGHPAPVTITVSGTITATGESVGYMIRIDEENGYPPLILRGKSAGEPGILDANVGTGTRRVILINNGNHVTLEDNLTITHGEYGVDIMTGSTFIMNGGAVKDIIHCGVAGFAPDSKIVINGGEVCQTVIGLGMREGEMLVTGGSFHGNTWGILVYDDGTVTMTGGLVDAGSGFGVYIGNDGSDGDGAPQGTFIMTGGSIENTANTIYLLDGTVDIRTVPPITGNYSLPIPNAAHVWQAVLPSLLPGPVAPAQSRRALPGEPAVPPPYSIRPFSIAP